MEVADAVRVIAEQRGLLASDLELLLAAVTRTPRGCASWLALARVSNSGHCGKVTINFDRGNITTSPEITTTIASVVKVGEGSR